MSHNRRDQGVNGVLEKNIPEHEKLTHDKLCELVSEATNFTKADIKKVINAYHKALCAEFANGKRFYYYKGYIKIRLQKRPSRMFHNWGRGPIAIPERDTFVVTPGTIYNLAIDHMNHKAKKAIADRVNQYKKKGDKSRP